MTALTLGLRRRVVDGNYLIMTGRTDEALVCYLMAFQENERQVAQGGTGGAFNQHELAILMGQIGFCHFIFNRLNEAIIWYQRGLTVEPEHALLHFSLGRCLAEIGQFEPALVHLTKAARAPMPVCSKAHLVISRVLRDLGRLDEALAAAQNAQRLEPDNTEVLIEMSIVLIVLERDREAYDVLLLAQRLDPRNPQIDRVLTIVASSVPPSAVA